MLLLSYLTLLSQCRVAEELRRNLVLQIRTGLVLDRADLTQGDSLPGLGHGHHPLVSWDLIEKRKNKMLVEKVI